jgi:hypothetical protein
MFLNMIKEQFAGEYTSHLLIPILLLIILGTSIVSAFFPVIVLVTTGGIVCGIGAVLISARWPEFFLILAIWTNFMKSAFIPGLAIGEFGATPYMIFTTLATIGFGLQILRGKRRLILPRGLWFLLLYCVFTTISLVIVQDLRLAIGAYARTFLDWMLLFSFIQMLTDRKRLKLLIVALSTQAIILASWGIVAGIHLELTEANRKSLFFWQQFQKNDFAAYLGLALVLALATFSVSKSTWKRLGSVVLMTAVPIGWMFTFSRGGFLAILVCLIVFLTLERNKKLLQRSLIATFLIGFLGLAVIVLVPADARNLAVDGLQSIVTGESIAERHTDTISFRLELARVGLEVIASRPVLGVGFNQWQFYSPLTTHVYDPQTGEYRETGYSIHNRFLLIAANNGLIALVGYIGFVTATLIYGLWWRRFATGWVRIYLHAFLAAVIGLQVAMLFAPAVIWEWPVFGIVLGTIHMIKMENQHHNSGDLVKNVGR